jgi:hypothetical protein
MTITTHLILVSAQPIPNLTPILDDSLRPRKVVMLVSPDMQERSKALENIYRWERRPRRDSKHRYRDEGVAPTIASSGVNTP